MIFISEARGANQYVFAILRYIIYILLLELMYHTFKSKQFFRRICETMRTIADVMTDQIRVFEQVLNAPACTTDIGHMTSSWQHCISVGIM